MEQIEFLTAGGFQKSQQARILGCFTQDSIEKSKSEKKAVKEEAAKPKKDNK